MPVSSLCKVIILRDPSNDNRYLGSLSFIYKLDKKHVGTITYEIWKSNSFSV